MPRRKAVRLVPFHNVETLCDCLELNPSDVLNVYMFHQHGEDTDAMPTTNPWCTYEVPSSTAMSGIVVVQDTAIVPHKWKNSDWFRTHGWIAPSPTGHKGLFKGFQHAHVAQTTPQLVEYHVWIFTQSSFQSLLDQYVPFAVECVLLPHESIWQNAVPFQFTHSIIDDDHDDEWKKNLLTSFTGVSQLLVWRAGLEWQFTKRTRGPCSLKVERGDVLKAQRTLSLALHVLELAQRILAVRDTTESINNGFHNSLLSHNEFLTWKDCMDIFQPKHEQMLTNLLSSFKGSDGESVDPTWLLQMNLDKHRKLHNTCHCKWCTKNTEVIYISI